MGGTSGGQNWWELVDVSTGKVLLRSWNKEDIVCLYEKLMEEAGLPPLEDK
jgi:hypothetical protein